ncbi:hypothetical protein HK098_001041 [Nowakowskiella sp. JEL0407]|nr:hypothetical protein HK098_001041 [Nowakowskiella sp. JEL0407]
MNPFWQLENATCYEQWSGAAEEMDILEELTSDDYDYKFVHECFTRCTNARETSNIKDLKMVFSTVMTRNFANISNPKLYSHSRIGTKELVNDFINELVLDLDLIANVSNVKKTMPGTAQEFNNDYQFFLNLQRSFGRTALLFSGGASFGLAHLGVLKALFEAKLLPRIISGSSIGSLIAAYACTKTDDELNARMDSNKLNLNFFDRMGFWERLQFLINNWSVFDAKELSQAIRENIGEWTFWEAFNRTRRILNVTVSKSGTKEMPRLLNYLTAPDVYIWSAVTASCALPIAFQSADILCKNPKGQPKKWEQTGYTWIDGSVENDLPMAKISELFFVNHFIVCQVNPHILPFLSNNYDTSLISTINQLEIFPTNSITTTSLYTLEAILMQKYVGDITIVPKIGLQSYFRILQNPDENNFKKMCLDGERATWEKLSMIKNTLEIELRIDYLMYRLRVIRVEQENYRMAQREMERFNRQYRFGGYSTSGGGSRLQEEFRELAKKKRSEKNANGDKTSEVVTVAAVETVISSKFSNGDQSHDGNNNESDAEKEAGRSDAESDNERTKKQSETDSKVISRKKTTLTLGRNSFLDDVGESGFFINPNVTTRVRADKVLFATPPPQHFHTRSVDIATMKKRPKSAGDDPVIVSNEDFEDF